MEVEVRAALSLVMMRCGAFRSCPEMRVELGEAFSLLGCETMPAGIRSYENIGAYWGPLFRAVICKSVSVNSVLGALELIFHRSRMIAGTRQESRHMPREVRD